MKKKLIIPVLGLALVGLVGYGTIRAYADYSSSRYSTVIQKLVERFGLNEEEVKDVFEEVREEHHTQVQTDFEDWLSEAVTSGDLTEEQKQLILEKHEELKSDKESFQDMTREEMYQAMLDRKTELKSWAEENEIDLEYFYGWKGMWGGHFGHMKGGFGWK
jgi:polyhydroxyalkanoate synthesis regulator phasin